MSRRVNCFLLAVIVGLLGYSVYLALHRLYQVDECCEMFTTGLLATGRGSTHDGGIGLLQFVLIWIPKTFESAVTWLAASRLVMLLLFWLNLFLLASATGEKLGTTRWLWALFAAATLGPLWDYGFEIRHDVLLLSGLLVIWCLVRVWELGRFSYFLVGVLVAAMQLAAHKAFAYVVPLATAILVFSPPHFHNQKAQSKSLRFLSSVLWFSAGLLSATLLFRYLLVSQGLSTQGVFAGARHVSGIALGEERFWPWTTLARLLTQTPLLLALLVPALLVALVEPFQRLQGENKNIRVLLSNLWSFELLPEALLFLGCLAVLFANPTPFPYNLLHLVPFAFLLAWRYARRVLPAVRANPRLATLAMGSALVIQLGTFSASATRHLEWTNARQNEVVHSAELLTDPAHDRVYEGVGLVASRRSIAQWMLHSQNIKAFSSGKELRLRDLLSAEPPVVFIPSYRTDWLPRADHDYVQENYVALADDFWVLGTILPSGGGEFRVLHAGRYALVPVKETNPNQKLYLQSDSSNPIIQFATDTNLAATMDGGEVSNRPITLAAGMHKLATDSTASVAAIWVGPHLDKPVVLAPNDHARLFINWY